MKAEFFLRTCSSISDGATSDTSMWELLTHNTITYSSTSMLVDFYLEITSFDDPLGVKL
jgi:hypothetical protein